MDKNTVSKIDVEKGLFIDKEEVKKRKIVGRGMWGLYFEKVKGIKDYHEKMDLSNKAQEKAVLPPYELLKSAISFEDYSRLIIKGQKTL